MRESRRKVIILGAAGRDFHDFNVYWRDREDAASLGSQPRSGGRCGGARGASIELGFVPVSRRLWIYVGVPIGILAGGALYTLWLAGQFKVLEPHFEGSCRFVRGVVGPEDITIHPGTGVAYISSVDRRALRRGEPGRG